MLAEEMLKQLGEIAMEHNHVVEDTDTYFTINPTTRDIESGSRYKNVLMQYDHNSQVYTFELPRYIDGHDMSLCTSAVVNFDNVESETETTNSGSYDMLDLKINPKNPDMVISSWLISRASTQLAGTLGFSIEYKCADDEGNVTYEWGTNYYSDVTVKPRKKNSNDLLEDHVDILEQWRTKIFGAGDSVIAEITSEGNKQVNAVKMESATQQEAVELKGAQTLDSIPEDYANVDAMADEAVRSKGDAIVCEVSGESITLKDSSDDYVRGLKLFGKSAQKTTTGKNLLDDSAFVETNSQGVLVTRNDDGSFHAAGTANTAYVSLVRLGRIDLKAGVRYIVSGTLPNMRLTLRDESSGTAYIDDNGGGASYVPSVDMTAYLNIRVDIGGTIDTTFYPMIRLATVEDPSWEPYTGGKPSPNPEYPQDIVSVANPNVRIFGKNLLNNVRYTTTQDGVTFTVNDDKTVVLNGTATADVYFYLTDNTVLTPGTYRLSGSPEGSSTSTYYMYVYPDYHSDQHGEGFTFEVKETTVYSARIYVKKGTVCNNVVFKPQIEIGTKTTAYEPYAGGSIDVFRTIPGLPVTSGGNYTDPDGQQWICDEVDLERGVYVQRVANLVVDETSDVRINVAEDGKTNGYAYRYFLNLNNIMINSESIMCDRLIHKNVNTLVGNSPENVGIAVSPIYSCIYLNINQYMIEDTVNACKAALAKYPLTVNYILATPIETPLTAEEIEAFKAIKTNYPNTTILNDAGAWMSVKYNADTKTYVENPKTLKLVDSSTGVVYELKIVDGALTVVPV